jgi:hypothetical protein
MGKCQSVVLDPGWAADRCRVIKSSVDIPHLLDVEVIVRCYYPEHCASITWHGRPARTGD